MKAAISTMPVALSLSFINLIYQIINGYIAEFFYDLKVKNYFHHFIPSKYLTLMDDYNN